MYRVGQHPSVLRLLATSTDSEANMYSCTHMRARVFVPTIYAAAVACSLSGRSTVRFSKYSSQAPIRPVQTFVCVHACVHARRHCTCMPACLYFCVPTWLYDPCLNLRLRIQPAVPHVPYRAAKRARKHGCVHALGRDKYSASSFSITTGVVRPT